MTTSNYQHLEQLVQAFGVEFVAWVLNMNAAAIAVPNSVELRPEQVVGVARLTTPASKVLTYATPVERDQARQLMLTAQAGISTEEALTISIRKNCGGCLPHITPSSQTVEGALLRLVRDCFPSILLIKEQKDIPTLPPVYSSRGWLDLARAILVDKDFAMLFPGHDGSMPGEGGLYQISSFVTWSSGSGGGYQLAMIPLAMVSFALSLGKIRGPGDIGAALDAAREAIEIARRLARGDEAEIPLIAQISNVKIDTSAHLELGDGSRIYPQGSAIQDAQATYVSLVGEKIQRITNGTNEGDTDDDSFGFDHQAIRNRFLATSRRLDSMRLALILTSSSKHIVAPKIDRWQRLNPLTATVISYGGQPGFQMPFEQATLNINEQTSAVWWFDRLMQIDTKSIDLGIRRLISAVTSRVDPLDGLIDAVMCWENLFSGTPETAFKVCGSIAKLLEPTELEVRAELFNRAKKIYATRSKLVHGGTEPEVDARDKLRNDAVIFAIRALVAMMQDDVLLAHESSTSRAQFILVGV